MELEDISVVFQILGRGDRFTVTRSIMHIIEVTPPSSSNDVLARHWPFFSICVTTTNVLSITIRQLIIQGISSSNGQAHGHLYAFARSSTISKPGSWVLSISTSVPMRGDDVMTKVFPHLA